MCVQWKFEFRKHLCEKQEQLLKKRENIKILEYQNGQ